MLVIQFHSSDRLLGLPPDCDYHIANQLNHALLRLVTYSLFTKKWTLRYVFCCSVDSPRSNAGQTVLALDPHMNEMMEKAGRKMNLQVLPLMLFLGASIWHDSYCNGLQGHYVGVPEGRAERLFGPVDIEGHKGTDQLYYVVVRCLFQDHVLVNNLPIL